MMKEVIRDIASGSLPLVGVLSFILAFVLILLRVAFLSRSEIEHMETMPLVDETDLFSDSRSDKTFQDQ